MAARGPGPAFAQGWNRTRRSTRRQLRRALTKTSRLVAAAVACTGRCERLIDFIFLNDPDGNADREAYRYDTGEQIGNPGGSGEGGAPRAACPVGGRAVHADARVHRAAG